MIDRDDTKLFKGDQADYRKKSGEAIGAAFKKLQACEKSEEKLRALFFELLQDFAVARRAIAEAHQTDDAHKFGIRRTGFFANYNTPMDDVYKPYNSRILLQFRKLLEPYQQELATSGHKKIKASQESSFREYGSSFEVEVFDESELAELTALEPIEFPDDFPVDLLAELEAKQELTPDKFETLRNAFELFYADQYNALSKVKLASYIHTLHKKYPYLQRGQWGQLIQNDGNLKSFYAIGTSRLTVGGKPTVASHYIVWLHRDGKNHPLARMQRHTISMIIHQPTFLIDPTLQEISKLFAKAVLLERKNRNELKEHIGLFRAYFAHAMPHWRGSAAIGEYFETLLYYCHGIEVEYSNRHMIDLEAFSTPLLADFITNYHHMIRLP